MKLESFGQKKQTVQETSKKLNGTEEFRTREGDIVALKWHICEPTHEDKETIGKAGEAVVFLPGVGLEADSPSVVQSAQDFADVSQSIAYSISTRINNSKTKNSQVPQAEAIRQFIVDHHLNEVTVVGHSQGGNKSIDLVAEIEKDNPEIQVRLILTSPGGLREQDPKKLLKNFFQDSIVDTPLGLLKQKASLSSVSNMGRALRLGNSVTGNIVKEIINSPQEFSEIAKREAEEAATLNKSATEIKAPIVVIFGAKDIALGAKEIIPDTAHNQSIRAQEERVEEMRKIFPNSAGIKVLEAGGGSEKQEPKFSGHGLHYARSKQIAEVSIGLLKRMERNSKTE